MAKVLFYVRSLIARFLEKMSRLQIWMNSSSPLPSPIQKETISMSISHPYFRATEELRMINDFFTFKKSCKEVGLLVIDYIFCFKKIKSGAIVEGRGRVRGMGRGRGHKKTL